MSLLQMSLSGAAMILVVVLIRVLALHKLPKRFFLLLWGVVDLRLLLPVSLPWAFSVYSLFRRARSPEVRLQASPILHAAPSAPAGAPAVSGPPAAMQAVDLWAAAWLTGVAVCTLYFGLAYLKCRREFRESLPVCNDYARTWLQAHPLRRTVSIRYSHRITAPLTYGVLRPVILVPRSTDWTDTETLDYVLAHELVHIRRFDALFKPLLLGALCVHWFNPLVWAMYLLANRDIELSCDEAVLRQFGADSRAGYALALIRMEENKSGFASLGAHFSKNSIEERIRAIMKIKKNSLAVLLAALVLAGGATAFFATSAKADSAGNTETQHDYTVEAKDSLMSFTGADGTAYYSWDGGETWTAMTDEEFAEAYPDPEVEWWTADEYAAWLENEKKELEGIIGEKGWTPSTGWFTWTEEMVAETVAEYEEILAKIRDGYLVSKTVDGSEDTMLMMNPLDMLLGSGHYGEITEAREDIAMTSHGALDYESLFDDYKRCGLDIDGNLYWNGQRVRIFVDGVEHESGWYSQYEHYDPEGTVDLHTVRERVDNGDGSYDLLGPLVRIEEFEPDQMFLDALDAYEYVGDEIQYEAKATSRELERYIPFGLTSETDLRTGKLTMNWNGQPVRSLFDPERQLWIANSLGKHGIDVEAVYENGSLTGLKLAEDSGREFVETGEVINAEGTIVEATAAEGTGDTSGETIAQRMEKYEPYGVAYQERGGKRTIRYNGRVVGCFADEGPDGVFSVRSTDAGAIDLRTVYDSAGKLSGVEIV